MRLFVLLRTAIVFLAGNWACFATDLNARREEELLTNSRSAINGIIPTGPTNQSVPPERSTNIDIKDTESRGVSNSRNSAEASKDLLLLSESFHLESLEHPLYDIANTVEQLKRAERADNFIDVVETPFKNGKWKTLIKVPDFPWENDAIRHGVFNQWLESYQSPGKTFQYMKVHLMYSPRDTTSMDPKLLWWFDYVKKYRELDDVGTKVTSSTASSYGVFGDDKLFAFLVGEYDLQTTGKDMSLASDSRQQVVTLFEMLRREPTTKKPAEDMQLYLFSNSDTKLLMRDVWLQFQVSPATIFDIIRVENVLGRVGGFEPVEMFSTWLEYVKMYWDHVNLASGQESFDYSSFIRLLQTKSWSKHVTTVLGSIEFRQVFYHVQQPDFKNHAVNLMTTWVQLLRLHTGVTSKAHLSTMSPPGRVKRDGRASPHGISLSDFFQAKQKFTSEEVYDMLRQTHSFQEIVKRFRQLQRIPKWQNLAKSMLEYTSLPSTVINDAVMTPDKYWRIFLPKGVVNPKDFVLLSRWYKYATAYIGSEKVGSSQLTNSAVYKLQQKNVPVSQYAEVSKAIELRPRLRKHSE